MKLADILALRPAAQDRASIATAIEAAEVTLQAMLDRAEALGRQAKGALLTAETDAIEALDREAEQAKLTADRIAMLLGEMRAALLAAAEREEAQDKAELEATAIRLDGAFVRAWEKHAPAAIAAAAHILAARRAADEAIARTPGVAALLPRNAGYSGPPMRHEMLPSVRLEPLLGFLGRLAELDPREAARRAEIHRQEVLRMEQREATLAAQRAADAVARRARQAREEAGITDAPWRVTVDGPRRVGVSLAADLG